jgi:hypothetical protein
MTDPIKGVKVPKRQHAEKVDVEPNVPTVVEAAPPPPEEDPLTDAERAEAAPEVPTVVVPPVALPTYKVVAGGRAWYRGQQIKFTAGETFTAETWDELAISGFRECGVTIERVQ